MVLSPIEQVFKFLVAKNKSTVRMFRLPEKIGVGVAGPNSPYDMVYVPYMGLLRVEHEGRDQTWGVSLGYSHRRHSLSEIIAINLDGESSIPTAFKGRLEKSPMHCRTLCMELDDHFYVPDTSIFASPLYTGRVESEDGLSRLPLVNGEKIDLAVTSTQTIGLIGLEKCAMLHLAKQSFSDVLTRRSFDFEYVFGEHMDAMTLLGNQVSAGYVRKAIIDAEQGKPPSREALQ